MVSVKSENFPSWDSYKSTQNQFYFHLPANVDVYHRKILKYTVFLIIQLQIDTEI